MVEQRRGLLRRHWRLFLGLLAAVTLLFGLFLQEHWVHDTYLVAWEGYLRMPGPLFSQGRVFSALFYYALHALAVPVGTAMAWSVFGSLVALTLAVVVLYDGAEALRAQGCAGRWAAALAGCAVCFNLFVPEFFLFYEAVVMSLGILLAVVAARVFAAGERRLLCLLPLTAALFCYQADGAFFLPLVVFFLVQRGVTAAKPLVLRTISAGLCYGAACLANLVFLRLVPADGRIGGGVELGTNLALTVKALGKILLSALGFLPDGWFLAACIAAWAVLLVTCLRARRPDALLAAAVAAVGLVAGGMLPLVLLSTERWYVVPRAVVAVASLPGLALLFLPEVRRWQAAAAAALVLAVAAVQVDFQRDNRRNNTLDAAEILAIREQVLDYEDARGAPLVRIEVAYDAAPLYRRAELRGYGDATLRILSVDWMPYPVLDNVLDKRIHIAMMPDETAARLFGGRDWGGPDPEQLVFEDDVLYLCLF